MERNVEYALSHHDGNGLLKPHVPFALLLTSVSTHSGIRGTRSHHKTRRFDLTPLLRFGWSPTLKHQLPPSNTTASPNKHNWTHLTNTAAPPQRPLRQVKVLWCIAAIFTVVWAARQLQLQQRMMMTAMMLATTALSSCGPCLKRLSVSRKHHPVSSVTMFRCSWRRQSSTCELS